MAFSKLWLHGGWVKHQCILIVEKLLDLFYRYELLLEDFEEGFTFLLYMPSSLQTAQCPTILHAI